MQQPVARTSLPCFSGASFVCLLSLFLAGCNKEEARSYSVSKENAAPAMAAPRASVDSGPAQAGSPTLRWTLPAGWTEKPAGGMRVGSFAVSKDGQQADVSIVPLGQGAGGELANVNRWRHDQLGLPAIDEAQLASAGEKVSIGTATGALYDLAGTDPKTQQPTRILGAILPEGGTTWFFKMIGNDGLVAQEKPAFKELLKSIQFGAGAAPDSFAQAHQGVNMSGGEVAPPAPSSSSDKPAWTVPDGWQEKAPSAMRVATFLVTGAKESKADVSVSKLGGLAGGILPNVNRWRAQVGLGPTDEAGLEKIMTTHEVNGMKIMMVEVAGRSVESGEPSRLLAAIVPRTGVTWFFKMFGNDELVAQQKAAFTKFVESARLPNVS